MYWDGLFSQNPPIHDLMDHNINELWVIQINPSTCAQVPTETHEILDRRNQLSGNLSMEQELKFIEMINRAIAEGRLNEPKFHPIHVARITLDRDLGLPVEARSADRIPGRAAGLWQGQGAMVPEGSRIQEVRHESPGSHRIEASVCRLGSNPKRSQSGGAVSGMGIRITGAGAYVPDRKLTNHELARKVDTSHEWISTKTGILERRISARDEAPSDMACQAARRCLKSRGRRRISR